MIYRLHRPGIPRPAADPGGIKEHSPCLRNLQSKLDAMGSSRRDRVGELVAPDPADFEMFNEEDPLVPGTPGRSGHAHAVAPVPGRFT
jgi:hypothetical protein